VNVEKFFVGRKKKAVFAFVNIYGCILNHVFPHYVKTENALHRFAFLLDKCEKLASPPPPSRFFSFLKKVLAVEIGGSYFLRVIFTKQLRPGW